MRNKRVFDAVDTQRSMRAGASISAGTVIFFQKLSFNSKQHFNKIYKEIHTKRGKIYKVFYT